LNGEQVNDGDELVGRTAALPPGTQAKLAYVHKGRPETATVTIGDGSKLSAKGVAR
jgi:S1-C subfamily serine protease